MTTFADQQIRIAALLQDTNVSTAVQGKYILQHQEELSRLARQKHFSQIVWFQGIAGQSLYPLPDNTVEVCHVLYNQHVLRYVTEQTLDYSGNLRSWEANTGEPTYWTDDNQGPNIIRVIPPPLRDGSAVPSLTFLPMYQDLRDNLCVFTYEDPALEVTNVNSSLPTLLDWEDVLVFNTVSFFAQYEQVDQNLPLAQNCMKLVEMWQQFLSKNGG
jgi:hypothetical protein